MIQSIVQDLCISYEPPCVSRVGYLLQEVHHKEWRVELRDGDVRDLVSGRQAIPTSHRSRGGLVMEPSVLCKTVEAPGCASVSSVWGLDAQEGKSDLVH